MLSPDCSQHTLSSELFKAVRYIKIYSTPFGQMGFHKFFLLIYDAYLAIPAWVSLTLRRMYRENPHFAGNHPMPSVRPFLWASAACLWLLKPKSKWLNREYLYTTGAGQVLNLEIL